MTWFMIGMLLLDGALFYFTPNLSRATVPLGVDVPSERTADPVVLRALRRFRIACVVATAGAILGTWLTRAYLPVMVLWLFAQLAAVLLAFAICRRPIQFAKRSGGWYADAQVRVGAEVLRTVPRRRPAWVAHGLACALALAAAIALVVGYDSLPDRYPTHWNLGGQADGWSSKSWLAVLAPAVVGMIAAALITAFAWGLSRRHDSLLPDGNPAAAQTLREANERVIQVGLGWINMTQAAVLALAALAPLLGLHGVALAAVVWFAIVAVVVVLGWIVVVSVRAQDRFRAASPVADAPQSPEDDRFWKLGIVYYNRDDPSLMVSKRSGTGFTINAARPAGMALYVCALVLLVFSVVLMALS